MIEEFKGGEIATDVCIIGAGAAGITVARALQDSGLGVALLESGGSDYEQDVQDLAAGENAGLEYYDLSAARLRFFGGTTAIWGGRCASLDAIDFEKRAWVPHSGWPFSKDTLQPFYAQAQALLDLPQIADNSLPDFRSPLAPDKITAAFWQFDEVFDRFTLRRCEDLRSARNIRIVLHAHVVRLNTSENGRVLETAEIRNLKGIKGIKGIVRARQFIIAAGGIEAPRLLMVSKNSAHPHGIGNNHDQLGRYFMEHPHARGAQVITDNPKMLFKMFPRFMRRQGHRFGMLMRPSDLLQAREGILNTGFTLAVRKHPGAQQVLYKNVYNAMRHELSPTKTGRSLWKLTRRASVFVQDHLGANLNAAKLTKPSYGIYAVMRAEQAPNPESRITLSSKTDALGIPLTQLDWRLSDIDKRSVAVAMSALDQELRRLNLGAAQRASWLEDDQPWEFDPLVSNHAIGGYHHMGGARMSADPKTGVVDAQCRVHGVENLYVASSAVFPTSGWANPTLTILALALRLSSNIAAKAK